MTKTQLESYLYDLRNTLCAYDYDSLNNVIFFNNMAVYEHLRQIHSDGYDMTVGDILDKISEYIPVSLSDSSLKFLMRSATEPEQLPWLELEFNKNNQMEFLQMLTRVSTREDWFTVINLCETVRQFRENEVAKV